jgi:polyphosphate glucokinase
MPAKNPKHESVKAPAGDPERAPLTLCVDVGGTGIKTTTLDARGLPVTDRTRDDTPKHATPKKVIKAIAKLARAQGKFDRASVGFPGYVKDGVVYTAANMNNGKGWKGFPLCQQLAKRLGKPVMLANDADVQGLGAVSGKGVELVVTLGTGFGSVIFVDGRRIHLELGHHPFHHGKTYEDELGRAALEKKGKKKWNAALKQAIAELQHAFNYDRLYIGGGNARHVTIKLPDNVKIVSNLDGLLGGIKLWESPEVAQSSGMRQA